MSVHVLFLLIQYSISCFFCVFLVCFRDSDCCCSLWCVCSRVWFMNVITNQTAQATKNTKTTHSKWGHPWVTGPKSGRPRNRCDYLYKSLLKKRSCWVLFWTIISRRPQIDKHAHFVDCWARFEAFHGLHLWHWQPFIFKQIDDMIFFVWNKVQIDDMKVLFKQLDDNLITNWDAHLNLENVWNKHIFALLGWARRSGDWKISKYFYVHVCVHTYRHENVCFFFNTDVRISDTLSP